MKKCLVLFVVALALMAVPAMSARMVVEVIPHDCDFVVQQAYWGTTPNTEFAGDCAGGAVISPFAVPGILSIDPGTNWANFITYTGAGTVTVKDVWLFKVHDDHIQCPGIWNEQPDITQHGTPSIRLWWPLMYEAPGTTFRLEVTYYVNLPSPGKLYKEIWNMKVDASLDSLKALIYLFHELPYGICEVPLISDEEQFVDLVALVEDIEAAMAATPPDIEAASAAVDAFENMVIDCCLAITTCPPNARPTGELTGIYNTEENPVCCKLLVDIEYIAMGLGIYIPGK